MFVPTQEDVARYQRLRAAQRGLNERMVRTIPKAAMDDIGAALGILRNGVLVLDDFEAMPAVLADCCLFEWYEDGENLVRRYANTHDAKRSVDETYLLDACQRAEFRVLVAKSSVPGAGLYFRDVLTQDELFVMDTAMSQGEHARGAALATRTIPLGEYWMTGGAGLPIVSADSINASLRRFEKESPQLLERSFGLVLMRAALECGAARNVRYSGTSAPLKKRRIVPKHQWRRR
ncbi:MAG TPA: hypothetical protein VGF49_08170 [Candidatus Solibacter sp.]|jgi:hypothetical protein